MGPDRILQWVIPLGIFGYAIFGEFEPFGSFWVWMTGIATSLMFFASLAARERGRHLAKALGALALTQALLKTTTDEDDHTMPTLKIKPTPEAAFTDQMTRKLLVEWADHQVRVGAIPDHPQAGRGSVYFEYALSKGWISKRDNSKLTSAGFKTAAAFLKR